MSDNVLDDFFSSVGTQKTGRSNNSRAPGAIKAHDDVADPRKLGGLGEGDGKRRWGCNDNNFWPLSSSYNELPPGMYTCERSQSGPFLKKTELSTDNLMILPDMVSQRIMSEFDKFWKLKEEFSKYGYLHKRGFLLFGPPGSGKTSLLHLMTATIINDLKGLVLSIDAPNLATDCMKMARQIEPDRPMICLLEDIDALVERHGEDEFLALLDGQSQVDNVIFVATTNYPERLDKRFVDRPSRFDTVEYVGMPKRTAREMYLKAKDPMLGEDTEEAKATLDQWVRDSKGFSVAHLRELIISVRCFGKPYEDVIKRLKKMRVRKDLNSTKFESGSEPGMGFAPASTKDDDVEGNDDE